MRYGEIRAEIRAQRYLSEDLGQMHDVLDDGWPTSGFEEELELITQQTDGGQLEEVA